MPGRVFSGKPSRLFSAVLALGTAGYLAGSAAAGWGNWLKPLNPIRLLSRRNGSGTLSNQEIGDALRQALIQAAKTTVARLGGKNGFSGNPKLAVPLPSPVRRIEGILRKTGQGKYVDDLKTALNRAASESVRQALPVFSDVIQKMTFEDVRRILNGGDDAATRYLREKAAKALRAKMLPVVRKATRNSGLATAFKLLMNNLGFAKNYLSGTDLDLDAYVTDKTLDTLFSAMAVQEKKIRKNPAARTTALLKKVFGSLPAAAPDK